MQRQSWLAGRKRLQHESESGAVSVEFAIWLPLIVVLTVTIVDASVALMRQASMWRVAGDVARSVATGSIDVIEAQKQLALLGYDADPPRLEGDMVRVQLSVPFSSVGTGSLLSPLGSLDVAVLQRLEPHARPVE